MNDRINELNEMLLRADSISDKYSEEAMKKNIKKKIRRHAVFMSARNISIFMLVAFSVMFIGVNTSKTFAETLEGIPVISNIAEKLSMSKSYNEAIENEYLTEIGMVAKSDIADVKLCYAIADDNALLLILEPENKEEYKNKEGYIELLSVNGHGPSDITCYQCGAFGNGLIDDNDGYTFMQIRWPEYKSDVDISLKLHAIGGETAILSYNFSLNEKKPPIITPINYSLDLSGHKICIKGLEQYPLSTRIRVSVDGDAELFYMDMTLADDKGNEIEKVYNSHFAEYDGDDVLFVFDSVYFRECDKLTLNIGNMGYECSGAEPGITLDTNMSFDIYRNINDGKAEYVCSYNVYHELSELKWDMEFSATDDIIAKVEEKLNSITNPIANIHLSPATYEEYLDAKILTIQVNPDVDGLDVDKITALINEYLASSGLFDETVNVIRRE